MNTQTRNAQTKAAGATRTSTLEVEGMTCPSCVGRVNRALRALHGIVEVDVQLRRGRVVVKHDESAGPEELVEALADAGYPSKLSPA